jgi:hypothetical protein
MVGAFRFTAVTREILTPAGVAAAVSGPDGAPPGGLPMPVEAGGVDWAGVVGFAIGVTDGGSGDAMPPPELVGGGAYGSPRPDAGVVTSSGPVLVVASVEPFELFDAGRYGS